MKIAFRRLGLALLAIALWPAAAPAGELPAADKSWIELRTAHFVLLSSATESRTREVARGLETLREVLRQVTPDLRSGRSEVNSPRPTFVYVFPTNRSFKPYLGPLAGASGYFYGRPDGNFVALEVDGTDPLHIVYHEYLHYFIDNNFRGVPLWFNEGVAEFYSTMQVTENRVDLGAPVPWHLQELQERFYPVADLLRVTHASPDYNEKGRRGAFYATSWLAVHYLLAGNPERRAQVGTYLQLIKDGTGADAAFEQAFKVDAAALEQELKAYARKLMGVYNYWRLGFKDLKVAEGDTVRRVPHDELLARLGLLMAAPNADPAFAKQHLDAALALNPNNSTALFGMGILHAFPQPDAEAGDLFRRAALADDTNAMAHYFYARSLMSDPAGVSFGSERGAEIRKHLARTLELNPDYGECRELLEQMTPPSERRAGEVELLEAALRKEPGRAELVEKLVNARFARHEWKAPREALERLIATKPAPEIEAWARQNLAVSRFNEGADLVTSAQEERGRALMRQAVEEAPTPELKKELERRSAEVKLDPAVAEAIRKAQAQVEEWSKVPPLQVAGSVSEIIPKVEALRAQPANPVRARILDEVLKTLRGMPADARGTLDVGATSYAFTPEPAFRDEDAYREMREALVFGSEGHYERELAVLDRIAKDSKDPDARTAAAERAKTIRTPGTVERNNRLFNAAVEKANRGDVRGALALMREVAAKTKQPQQRDKAQALVDKWTRRIAAAGGKL